MIPGEIVTAPGEIELNANRDRVTLSVANTGSGLPARHPGGDGGAIRAGPDSHSGPGGLCRHARSLRLQCRGHGTTRRGEQPMTRISRQAYASMYGPTVGDRVRLGDSELRIQVEEDRTV